jgi:transcriptional regulator with XRE-family HTH domain
MLRKELGISFIELVAETELGSGYISELERGLVVPSAASLERIARALGVLMCDLVTFPEDDDRQRLIDRSRGLTRARVRSLLAEVEAEEDR